MRLDVSVGSLICVWAVACASDAPSDDEAMSGGSAGTAAGSTPQGGAAGKGGAGGAGGAAAGASGNAGASAGSGAAGATGGAGAGAAGTGAGAGGANGGGAGVSSAGAGAGGSETTGGSPPIAGNAGQGGNGGTSGAAGSGGSGGMPQSVSGLPVPPGDANRPRPSGTPGDITVLDWAGFKAAVSYTFDDSNQTQIQHFSEMMALGVPFTFYLWTGKSESSNAVWGMARDQGHELGNHTQSHSSNGSGADIDAAQNFIMTTFNVTAYTMAAPNGAAGYTDLAKPRFIINRGVSNKVILPNDNTDPFTLPTYIPPQGASESAFNQQVDDARNAGGWRTMCIHGFTGGSDGAYQPVPFDQWKASVEHAKELGDVWIGTVEDVGAYWLGQKALANAQTSMSGAETTFTWTLPANFPPGKYLRVTVEGGTLKQGGVELPWFGNGYYEISLDEESVTLSP